MLKMIIATATLTIASPVLAQTAQKSSNVPTGTEAVAPSTATAGDPTVNPAPSMPAAAQSDPAAAQPATGDAIAQVVDSGWSTYDVNGDGKLSESEFAAWMNKVKSDSDPKLDANAPATKRWNQAAFAQADTDKSRTVSKAELTAFLSKGQNAS